MLRNNKKSWLWVLACVLAMHLAPQAYAQSASAPLVIVANINKDLLQVNFQCNPQKADCTNAVSRINENDIRYPQAIALGISHDKSFAFVSNSWGRDTAIRLFTQGLPGAYWEETAFVNAAANVMTVVSDTADANGLYVAENSWFSSDIRVYPQNDSHCADNGPMGFCRQSRSLGTVKVNGARCFVVTGIVEYPRASGNLIVTCALPQGLASISADTHSTTLAGPRELGIIPIGSALAPTNEAGNFLLLRTLGKNVYAFDLDANKMQKQRIVRMDSLVTGISAGLCVDNKSCAVVTQAGSGGIATLVELSKSTNGNLQGTPVQSIGNELSLPVAAAMANHGTVSLAECMAGPCAVGNSTLSLANVTDPVDPNATLAYRTEGIFVDPRFISPGVCVTPAVPLPLAFTHIPGLEHASIDAQHCARDNGLFFIDVIDDGGLSINSGTISWFTDDDGLCYQTGDPVIAPIEDLTYGLWIGDDNDHVPSEDEFAEDRLVGCINPRMRATDTLSFLVENFQGHQDFTVGNTDPHGLLLTYGDREINESLDIVENDSACSTSMTAACTQNIAGWTQALVGWNLQAFAGNSVSVALASVFGGGTVVETEGAGLAGLQMTLRAQGGNLAIKSLNGFSAIGVSGGSSGDEIDIGQSIDVGLSASPRGTTTSNVPFKVPSLSVAMLFDGPEFGDVEEIVRITATLADGSELSGLLQSNYVSDSATNPVWSLPGATTTLLSPADSSGAAVVQIDAPFGAVLVTSLRFEPVAVNYAPGACPNSGGCSNQSDVAIRDISIQVPDRVDTLGFAYQGLITSLCPVSTRIDGRPDSCTSGPFVSQFNTTGPDARNYAGRMQVTAESVGRFIGHNICLLDTGFQGGSFCSAPPPWRRVDPIWH